MDLDHKAIKSEHCAQGRGQMVNAATVEADSRTEDSMVNSLSMRNFHPSADVASGHDQFLVPSPVRPRHGNNA
ncbi:hypothetical protein RAA17_15775 [Komagataeibacter rhaeticus]|nr:hypothetical protein [Komagataeibacter rhaeticus]